MIRSVRVALRNGPNKIINLNNISLIEQQAKTINIYYNVSSGNFTHVFGSGGGAYSREYESFSYENEADARSAYNKLASMMNAEELV